MGNSWADATFGKRARSNIRRIAGHKYNARRTTDEVTDRNGTRLHTFPSAKEARRYQELALMVRAGEIYDLELQPRFPIVVNGTAVKYPTGRPLYYVGDFRYTDRRTRTVHVEDVKGVRKTPRAPGVKKPRHEGTDTDAARIKRALVEAIYGVRVEIV